MEKIWKDSEMKIQTEKEKRKNTHRQEGKENTKLDIPLESRGKCCPCLGCVHKPLCLNAAFLQVHYSVDITSGLMEKLLLDTQNEWVVQAATKICVCMSGCAYVCTHVILAFGVCLCVSCFEPQDR